MESAGKLKFCKNCMNIMDVVAEKDSDLLKWKCSIECPVSQKENLEESDEIVVLSETTDDALNNQQNPYNEFTIYDSTLLRCMRVCDNKNDPKHSENPTSLSEMIIFKQDISISDSYFICTVCNKRFSVINGKMIGDN